MATEATILTETSPAGVRLPAVGFGRRARIAALSAALALVVVILSHPAMGDWCSFAPDGFRYLTTARTLAETGNFPPHRLMAPPGFPIVVAPLLFFGDPPFLALRVMSSICWIIAAVMTCLLHRRELGEGLAWTAGLLVATSPVLLSLTTTPLSEPVFLAISSAALVVMHTWWRRPVDKGWAVALGGLLAAAALMVRSVGVVLLPVMGLTLMRHRAQSLRRRVLWSAVFALCSLGPWAAWQIRQSAFPPGPTYWHTWTSARGAENTDATGPALQIERLTRFGPMRLESIKETLLPKELFWRAYHPPLDVPTTGLIGGCLVAIALIRFLRFRSPIDAYVLLTLFMLSLWPWDEGVRLVAPLIPVLVGYPLWVGASLWRAPETRRRTRLAVAVALLLVLAGQAGGVWLVQSRLPARRDKAAKRFAAMSALARWHTENAPEGNPWLAIVPDQDNSKLLVLGAAYLSRRPVTTIDVPDEMTVEVAPAGESCAFLHASLSDSEDVIVPPNWTPTDTLGGFVVLQPDDGG